MAKPRVLVLRAAGTNCDEETAFAFELAGASAERIHVNRLIEAPQILGSFQILAIPGGFSYGDDIASGKILANQLVHRLSEPLAGFVAADKFVLGICNGFQVLVKAGLLPGAGLPAVTLTFNDSARFEARWVRVRAEHSVCPLLESGEEFYLPVAHGEGKVVIARASSESTAETAFSLLKKAKCIALRYVAIDRDRDGYPANPNGSEFDIAGLCDPTGKIFALMPHPERCVLTTHRPDWTRHHSTETDGLRIFRRAVSRFQH